jgi:hypothetical protein
MELPAVSIYDRLAYASGGCLKGEDNGIELRGTAAYLNFGSGCL